MPDAPTRSRPAQFPDPRATSASCPKPSCSTIHISTGHNSAGSRAGSEGIRRIAPAWTGVGTCRAPAHRSAHASVRRRGGAIGLRPPRDVAEYRRVADQAAGSAGGGLSQRALRAVAGIGRPSRIRRPAPPHDCRTRHSALCHPAGPFGGHRALTGCRPFALVRGAYVSNGYQSRSWLMLDGPAQVPIPSRSPCCTAGDRDRFGAISRTRPSGTLGHQRSELT